MQIFRSATLKLTGWYLAILMTISITFSVIIYQLNYREVSNRLLNLQHSLTSNDVTIIFPNRETFFGYGPGSPFFSESQKAASQMALSLVYINLVVLITGGMGSYFLARRTLRPIEEMHEAQSRFTSDASHELRTPLAAMKAELEVTLRDPALTIEESREVLESNLEEVNKLSRLSEMLLKLSRLDHDTLERQQVDIGAALESILKRYPHDRKRFTINTRKKTTVVANEPAISELIAVLIDNAIKYSPPKSKIHVRIFGQRGSLGFEIVNKGTPIPEELQSKLFERFFRADVSRTNSSRNGYGLGLALAKKIVDIHHGEITVSSTKEGTRFSFYLPLTRVSGVKNPRS